MIYLRLAKLRHYLRMLQVVIAEYLASLAMQVHDRAVVAEYDAKDAERIAHSARFSYAADVVAKEVDAARAIRDQLAAALDAQCKRTEALIDGAQQRVVDLAR